MIAESVCDWNKYGSFSCYEIVLSCHRLKEALSHVEFCREIYVAAMKIGLYVLKKQKRYSTSPVNMDIIMASISRCLSYITRENVKNTTCC